MLPAVTIIRAMNTTNNKKNAASTTSKKFGFRDEPGVKIFEKKGSSL